MGKNTQCKHKEALVTTESSSPKRHCSVVSYVKGLKMVIND